MNRRQFGVAMAAVGLPAGVWAARNSEVEKIRLSRNGWMPNNDRLPVLLYRRAFDGAAMADQMEAVLEKATTTSHPKIWFVLLSDGSLSPGTLPRRAHHFGI